MTKFSESQYQQMISELFCRFPSFQKEGAGAYKPGLGNMEFMDSLCGHPHRKYKTIHIAGTNGKGSVANMIAAVLAAHGYKTGLYTSPHILDFRERMRVMDSEGCRLVDKDFVWDFVKQWKDSFDHIGMSFFEITTAMAFAWFAEEKLDIAVIETGLGGRLDSTNIINPVLSVITNIGLDHCDILGNSLGEIAFEKAGIIKPIVPAVIGESSEETDPVFERKVLYSNLSESEFMGDRSKIASLLSFADKTCPRLSDRMGEILPKMDLQGSYQKKNLRTVLAALEQLGSLKDFLSEENAGTTIEAIKHTAAICQFHGRWEQVCDKPKIICDIGHNAHGLKYNFSQLSTLLEKGLTKDLVIVYGSVADKDVDASLALLPDVDNIIFTNASTKRALDASIFRDKWLALHPESKALCINEVGKAIEKALALTADSEDGMIYVGGSTYVVAEAIPQLQALGKCNF